MFVVQNGALSATIGEAVFEWGKPFQEIVAAGANGRTWTLKKGEAPERLGGSLLSLFVFGNPPIAPHARGR
jgi:hypothetical protein